MTATVLELPTPGSRDEADRLERALEAVPFIGRACVVRDGAAGTVVLVTLDRVGAPEWARRHGLAADPDSLAAHPALLGHLDRVLADATASAPGVRRPARVHVLARGWLPGRDAFPDPIRRRCAKARYAPLLGSFMTPVLTPLIASLAAA